jgi:hypothetical protein
LRSLRWGLEAPRAPPPIRNTEFYGSNAASDWVYQRGIVPQLQGQILAQESFVPIEEPKHWARRGHTSASASQCIRMQQQWALAKRGMAYQAMTSAEIYSQATRIEQEFERKNIAENLAAVFDWPVDTTRTAGSTQAFLSLVAACGGASTGTSEAARLRDLESFMHICTRSYPTGVRVGTKTFVVQAEEFPRLHFRRLGDDVMQSAASVCPSCPRPTL